MPPRGYTTPCDAPVGVGLAPALALAAPPASLVFEQRDYERDGAERREGNKAAGVLVNTSSPSSPKTNRVFQPPTTRATFFLDMHTFKIFLEATDKNTKVRKKKKSVFAGFF